MIRRRTVAQGRHRHLACRPILTGMAVVLGLGLVSISEARASTYRVYTASAASSMVLNANDDFCSLAEAVKHASGSAIYNCADHAPGSSEQRIELLESAGKPFSTNHFKINDTLTFQRQGVRIRIVGSGAFIDSTARYSAFVIVFKSIGFFEGVTLTNTAGNAGGRLIENFGGLGFNHVTIANGDVTGSHHLTGRGGGIFNGNTQGMPAAITFAQASVITGNKARKGGGIYNDAANINDLQVTISNNTATEGGGIYNFSTTPMGTTWTNGRIVGAGVIVRDNHARAGGGIFNRGLVELLDGSSITGNKTDAAGTSQEKCTGSASCDGLGGGVLTAHISAIPATPSTPATPSGSDTRFMLLRSTISSNTASARGGAIYSVGVLELAGSSINGNSAPNGAALYVTAPTDGSQQYCNTYGNSDVGPATITSNWASVAGGYSIVAGGPGSATTFARCGFQGLPAPGRTTYMTASGNSGSNFCAPAALAADARCPQPCGGNNQACCPSAICNTGLVCFEPAPGIAAYCRMP